LKYYANYFPQNYVEIETFLNSIDISDKQGKEVVLLVNTGIKNSDKTFYTDSNGLEMQKRILNYRPTWKLTVNQPTSGNYYPINAMIYIQDGSKRAVVLNDRS